MKQQDARNEILETIRKGKPESQPLPEYSFPPYPGKPRENLITCILAVNGKAVLFRTREEAVSWLMAQEELDMEKHQVYSSAPGIEGNVPESDLADLRNASKIHSCITEGEMGVGETGSIWVTDESLRHAVCALLCQHLFILLDSSRITGDMHSAYSQIRLQDHQYGSFFTGPSATADIEAVRITGAQGPLSMTALLYNCEEAEVPPKVLSAARK